MRTTLAILLLLLAACGGGSAVDPSEPLEPGTTPDLPVPEPEPDPVPTPTPEEPRPVEGNAGSELLRLAPSAYADGISSLAGADRPDPRTISNAVCAQEESIPNAAGATDYLWQWGQFLDHDLDLSPEADPIEPADIVVPAGDPDFDPFGTGAVLLHLNRSAYTEDSQPRQQVNAITSFIDASQVYGSDLERALALRTLDGTGRLRTSAGGLLPFNEEGLENAGGTDPALFLAGDVRANEQIALTALHTLFVREHNRLTGRIRDEEPILDGDEIYERARRIVAAQMQVITYSEFLPLLLGPGYLEPYGGYDDTVDARISNVFATACYRLGHSLLSSTLLRIDAAGEEIEGGHLALRDAFFRPSLLATAADLDPILRGLAAQPAQELDAQMVSDVRNVLFGPPGAGGLDLASLNLERGRDHGLADYNSVRAVLGLPRKTGFADITSDAGMQARLASVYASVDRLDPWVGALAEDRLPDAMVGELCFVVLQDQFRRLRDGDPYWFERTFRGEELERLRATRLSDIIRRNTNIGDELAGDVFRVADNVVALAQAPEPEPIDEVRLERIRERFRRPR